MLIEGIAWAGFGLIFGSFANVLILRRGVRPLSGRSACPRCAAVLAWYELVPVVSWLALRGRCAHCRGRISAQYPLVEALMGAGFLALGLAPAPLLIRVLGCALFFFFLAIAAYDLRHMLIPNPWAYASMALALASTLASLAYHSAPLEAYAVALAAGPLVSAPLFFMWYFSGGRWMGFGDVKLALAIGWLLGAGLGYAALMYSFILGALVGVMILLPLAPAARAIGITRFRAGEAGFTMRSEVPFGPFLILGTCIIWISALYSYAPVLGLIRDLALWN